LPEQFVIEVHGGAHREEPPAIGINFGTI
jgi:hypothetical protein